MKIVMWNLRTGKSLFWSVSYYKTWLHAKWHLALGSITTSITTLIPTVQSTLGWKFRAHNDSLQDSDVLRVKLPLMLPVTWSKSIHKLANTYLRDNRLANTYLRDNRFKTLACPLTSPNRFKTSCLSVIRFLSRWTICNLLLICNKSVTCYKSQGIQLKHTIVWQSFKPWIWIAVGSIWLKTMQILISAN
jgi:hypothetical protein